MDTIQQYGLQISKMVLLLKSKGVETSRRGFRWMDGQTSGRPQRTHTWAILAACLGMLPLWGFLNFSGCFLGQDSRYR